MANKHMKRCSISLVMSKKVNENNNETAPQAEWLKFERLTISSAGEDEEQVEFSYIAVNWSINQYSHFRKLSVL